MMTTKNKALLLDAGFAALPILAALGQQGYQTAVCGSKPQDPGHQFADLSFNINYADQQQVLELARSLKIDALLPGVTDVSYLTGCHVAQQLGLPGFDHPDTAETIFKKGAFRRWANQHGYPVPQAVSHPAEASTLPLPLMIKPVDAYSGLGITLVDSREAILPAWQQACAASSDGEAVIETWIEGTLHSHSAFIRNGRIVAEYFVDEFCTVYPWQVNSSSLSTALDTPLKNQVSDCLQSVVDDLKLCDGLLHTQFIRSKNDFWLIELTRRCPGDLYSRLIELSTATPYALWFAQPFIGQRSDIQDKRPAHQRLIARHTLSVSSRTPFTCFSYGQLPARIVATVPLKKPGEMLECAPRDRAGIIFAEFGQLTELSTYTPLLKAYFTLGQG